MLKKIVKGIKSYDFLIFSFKFNSAAAEFVCFAFYLRSRIFGLVLLTKQELNLRYAQVSNSLLCLNVKPSENYFLDRKSRYAKKLRRRLVTRNICKKMLNIILILCKYIILYFLKFIIIIIYIIIFQY